MKTKDDHIKRLESRYRAPSMSRHGHPNSANRWERFLTRYMAEHGLSKEALAEGKFHKPWEEQS
jgi:hypothetical protein